MEFSETFRERKKSENHLLACKKCITGVDISASADLLVPKRKKRAAIPRPHAEQLPVHSPQISTSTVTPAL